MAEISNKYPQNVSGKFYVDSQCIDCDLCREIAPDNFTRDDNGGHSFVFKQPETPEEEAKKPEMILMHGLFGALSNLSNIFQ